MGNSWGHTLAPLTEAELGERNRWAIDYAACHPESPLPTRPDHDAEGRRLCTASGKCRNTAAWWGTYRYVTGRAGRVSTATKALCDDHAAKWRSNHGAVVLEQSGYRGRPLDAALRQVTETVGPTSAVTP